jgi:hypothetical protein
MHAEMAEPCRNYALLLSAHVQVGSEAGIMIRDSANLAAGDALEEVWEEREG